MGRNPGGSDPSTPSRLGLRLWSFALGGAGGDLVCWSHHHQLCSGVGAAISSGSRGSEFTLKLLAGVGRVCFCQRCSPKEVMGREFYDICAAHPFKTSMILAKTGLAQR